MTHPHPLSAPGRTLPPFVSRHRDGVDRLLEGSVKRSTQEKYSLSWRRWRDFLVALAPSAALDSAPDAALLPANGPPARTVKLLSMFTSYLARDLALSVANVSATMSGLKYHFQRLFHDTEAFDDARLKACKQGLYRDPTVTRPSSNHTTPVTLEMVQSITTHFSTPSLHKRSVAVAVLLAFSCMLRPGEYCNTSKYADHIIHADQVMFERAHPRGPSTFHTADALPNGFTYAQCVSVKIVFLSAKNQAPHARHGQAVWFSTTTAAQIKLPAVLFEWAQAANLQATDPFTAYRLTPQRATAKWLSYGRLNNILKYTAQRFGVSPAHFSCHGLRVGGASLLRAAGLDDGFILTMGRWKGLPSSLIYQASSTASNDRMLNVLSTSTAFTTRDLRLAQPPDRPAVLPVAPARTLPRAWRSHNN